MRWPAIVVLMSWLALGQTAEVRQLLADSETQVGQQHFPDAIQLAQRALDLSLAASDKTAEADSLDHLSNAYFYARKLDLAVDAARRELAVATEAGDARLSTKALGMIADGLRDQGHLEEARGFYERQLEAIRGSGDRGAEATNLRMTSLLYRLMGDRSKAVGFIAESLSIARDLKNPKLEAPTLMIAGVLENEVQHFEAALQYYEAALEIPGLSPVIKSQVIHGMGTAHCNLKHYDRCAAFARQELDEAIASQNPERIAMGYFKLAYPQSLSGDHAAAYESNRKALEYLRTADHDPYEEWHFIAAVGQEARHLGHTREAIDSYQQAIAIVERLRQRLVPTEDAMSKAAADGMTKELFDETINLQFSQAPPDAFQTSELARARAFLALLAESKVDLRRDLTPSQRERETAILVRINKLQRELTRVGLDAAARKQQGSALEAAESELEALRLEVRHSNPNLAAIQYPQPLGLEQIQKEVLQPGVTLIEYTVGPSNSYVWAISRDRFTSALLPSAETLEKLVDEFRKSLNAPISGLTAAASEAETLRLSAQLYRELIKPVESMLAGSRSVIIVPDGVLYYVPFEALTPGGRGDFLLRRFPISYAPSATSLALGAKPAAARKQLLAFGDPAGAQDPLPYTRDEVNGIAALFPAGQRTVYLGAAARADTVKSESLDGYRYIHFATHGILDEQHPERSGLALSGGPLQVREITDLRLQADLVSLSACSTGLGKLVSGEGMLGLVRAFLYAGASSVAVSLWNVNDAATATLMKSFYRNLSRGVHGVEAIRNAKLDLLRQDNALWHQPHYWAAFVLWLR